MSGWAGRGPRDWGAGIWEGGTEEEGERGVRFAACTEHQQQLLPSGLLLALLSGLLASLQYMGSMVRSAAAQHQLCFRPLCHEHMNTCTATS